MNVNLKLTLGEYQLIELRRMAEEAQTSVAGIVQGILTMYLNNQVKQVSGRMNANADSFIRAVVNAVEAFRDGECVGKKPPSASTKGGRRPRMTPVQVTDARRLREQGLSFAKIGKVLDLSQWLVRDVLNRSGSDYV